jgi:Glycosyl hydrolase family 47
MIAYLLQDKTVSIFETTIRILGGLLSAHLIANDYATVWPVLQFCFYYIEYVVGYLASQHNMSLISGYESTEL